MGLEEDSEDVVNVVRHDPSLRPQPLNFLGELHQYPLLQRGFVSSIEQVSSASISLPFQIDTPSMASIYSCDECGANLNLSTIYLFPADYYFEAGNKGTLSFSQVDASTVTFEKEDKIRPFFETLNYWGIQRQRTKIKCNGCGKLVGYIYDDGPPLTDSPGQMHMGPSQVIPRCPRYRFKTKALKITSET